MDYPYYSMSVPVFTKALQNLMGILDKAMVFAAERKVSDAVMCEARLAIDMLPLSKQVQIASDNAKGCCAKLAGMMPPSMEDNEKTLGELKARCQKTIDFLATLTPEQFAQAAETKVKLPYFPTSYFLGKEYFPQHAVPNFFFHVVTAYDILRSVGVAIGKGDYIGDVPRYEE